MRKFILFLMMLLLGKAYSQDVCTFNLNAYNITSTTATLSWVSPASEFSVIIYLSPSEEIVQEATVYQNTYLVEDLSANTIYYYYVKAPCDEVWLGPFYFWTASEAQTIFNCNYFFYDSGGPASDYSNNENGTTTICPENKNSFLTISFNSFSLGENDLLAIYDGDDLEAPLIGYFSGSDIASPITSTHPSGCLTFAFTSDGSATGSGWDAVSSCTPSLGMTNVNKSTPVIYPNPSNSIINIKCKTLIKEINIITIDGKQLVQSTVNSFDFKVDISNLFSGPYILNLISEDNNTRIKLLKN